MHRYNEEELFKAAFLYNELTNNDKVKFITGFINIPFNSELNLPESCHYSIDEVICKALALNKYNMLDISKKKLFFNYLKDFVEFAPNSSNNLALKTLIINQDACDNNVDLFLKR